MVNKLLLTLAVVLSISASGNGLTCYECGYNSTVPKEQQKCSRKTVSCSTGYCFALTFTDQDGVSYVVRDCDLLQKSCPPTDKREDFLSKITELHCCNTDRCNSATGTMAAKFTLCVMFIGGFLFA